MFCYCFAGALYNNFILNWIFFSAEKALTVAEWLLVNGLAWLVSGMAWKIKGEECFNRTTVNATIPLHTR